MSDTARQGRVCRLKVYAVGYGIVMPLVAIVDFLGSFEVRFRYHGGFRAAFKASRRRIRAAMERELGRDE